MPLSEIIDLVFAAGPAVSSEAANPRHAYEWVVFEEIHLPDGRC